MFNKIAIFTPLNQSDRGGAQAYINDFIDFIRIKNQRKCLIISPDKNNDYKYYRNENLFSTLSSKLTTENPICSYLFAFIIYLQIIYLRQKYKFEYLYSVGIYPILLVYKFFPFFLPKLILRPYGYDIQLKKNFKYGIRLNNRINKIYKEQIKYHKYISISEDVYKELRKLNVKQNNILKSGNSININKFLKVKSKKINSKKLQREYIKNNDLPNESLICLTVSSYLPKKRLDHIFKLAKYYDRNNNFKYKRFIIFGKDLTKKFNSIAYENSSVEVIDSDANHQKILKN